MKKNHSMSLWPTVGLALLVVSLPLSADTPATPPPAASPAPAPSADASANPAGQGAPADVQAAMQLPEGPDKAKALNDSVKAWVQSDPVAAFTWILALPAPLYEKLKGNSSAAAASPNVKAAGDYLLQQPPDRATMMLHGFSIGWALKDSAAAEAWCTQIQTTRDFRYTCVFSVADGLCRKKAADATAWALTLTQPDDRDAAIDGAITIWIRGDLAPVTDWIKQLNPVDMKWAAHIAARNWGSKRTITLAAWLDQLPLSADDKAEVLKGPQPDSFHISLYQPAAAAAPSKP